MIPEPKKKVMDSVSDDNSSLNPQDSSPTMKTENLKTDDMKTEVLAGLGGKV